jgi:SusD family.
MLIGNSCKKGWLDVKSDSKTFIPSTLKDFELLLNHESFINDKSGTMEEASADNFYLLYNIWNTTGIEMKNSYVWEKDILVGKTGADWNNRYQRVFISNIILEGLDKLNVSEADTTALKSIKGRAMFVRALALYYLAQGYCAPYNKNTAGKELGIPLRISTDFNVKSIRSTVEETYKFITDNLKESAELLPVTSPYVTQPNKTSAYALLARVYLAMEEYEQALNYANLVLAKSNQLIDFNTLNANAPFPLLKFNKEVIYHDKSTLTTWYSQALHTVDTTLYKSYDLNDLRRKFYFTNNGPNKILFKGSYDQSAFPFTGIATDEIYLIRSECYARTNELTKALKDLNDLLKSRWSNLVPFVPAAPANPEDALVKILAERRKELIFRNLRWTDLRRLNKDPRFSTTLLRNLNNVEYKLLPNSSRYIFPIPSDAIAASGMQQNPRD